MHIREQGKELMLTYNGFPKACYHIESMCSLWDIPPKEMYLEQCHIESEIAHSLPSSPLRNRVGAKCTTSSLVVFTNVVARKKTQPTSLLHGVKNDLRKLYPIVEVWSNPCKVFGFC